MTARPIIFSAPMIRALLAGEKTQTRRIAKVTDEGCKPGFITPNAGFVPRRPADHVAYCPYGKPGDTLWVRENYQYAGWTDDGYPLIRYQADGAEEWCNPPEDRIESVMDIWAELSKEENYNIDQKAADRRWRPSIHMPRWASRITLEITGVRVERLQDISEADAIAEGIERLDGPTSCSPWKDYSSAQKFGHYSAPSASYRSLWESIHGPDAWDANPYVWVIEFRRVGP